MFSVSMGCLLHAADLHQDRAMASNTVVTSENQAENQADMHIVSAIVAEAQVPSTCQHGQSEIFLTGVTVTDSSCQHQQC